MEEKDESVSDKTFPWEDGDFIEAGEPTIPAEDLYPDDQENGKATDVSVINIDNSPFEIELGQLESVDGPKRISFTHAEKPTKKFRFLDHIREHYPWMLYVLHFIPLKWQGVAGKKPPKMTRFKQTVISSILGFMGIFLIQITDEFYLTKTFTTDNEENLPVVMLSGSYAATAVLVYEAYQSPLAQPRNVIGSYFVNSLIGVSTRIFCQHVGIPIYVAGALALALGLAGMNVTKTVHPPGGACALIAVIGGKSVHALGYGFVLTSIGGSFMMVAVAVVGNNLFKRRQYPLYWY
jgi:hypothetical protein